MTGADWYWLDPNFFDCRPISFSTTMWLYLLSYLPRDFFVFVERDAVLLCLRFLARDAFVIERIVALLPRCSSVRLSVCLDGRVL